MPPTKKKIIILISGNGTNMHAIADAVASGILKDYYEIALVISNNPTALGVHAAKLRGIPVICKDAKALSRSSFDEWLLQALAPVDPDYIVLAGYNRLLSPTIVDKYRHKILNIHPADTRLYQGLQGYQWAFDRGMETTAITVHYVDEGCDTGDIIAQENVCLKGLSTLEAVQKAGLLVEHKLYSQVLRDLAMRQETICAE